MSVRAIFVVGTGFGRAGIHAPGTTADQTADASGPTIRIGVALVNRRGTSALIRGGSGLAARARECLCRALTIGDRAAARRSRASRVEHGSRTQTVSRAACSLFASSRASACLPSTGYAASSRGTATRVPSSGVAAPGSACVSARAARAARAARRSAAPGEQQCQRHCCARSEAQTKAQKHDRHTASLMPGAISKRTDRSC